MNSKHQKTLKALLVDPVNGSLEWARIEALLVTLGCRVIDIDDIITFRGTSVLEFETAMQTAVDGYLLACEQLSQATEKPASGRLMLRVDPAIHAAALKASARSGQSLNKWAEKALNQAAHAG